MIETNYFQIICPQAADGRTCGDLKGTLYQCQTCKWYTDLQYTVSKTPHKCPICEGRGIVPGGFYNSIGDTCISSDATESCRACSGTGVIYS